MEIGAKLLEVFMLGVIGGAMPGPILTSVFTEIVNSGLVGGVRVIFRAVAAEIIVAGAILFVFSMVNLPADYVRIISVLGAAFLIYLAASIWKIDKVEGEGTAIFNFSKIFLLTVLNSGFLIFWLTVCVPRALALEKEVAGGEILFLLMFEFGWFFIVTLLAFLFSRFRPLLLRKNLVGSVFKFFALVLLLFALNSLYENFTYIIK